MHGFNRCPMGDSGTDVPAEAATGRAWSAMEGSSHGTERSSLDTAHWSTLARFAISLSALSDLPSSLPTVAARRVVNRSIDLLGPRPARPRQTGSVGNLHRRQFQQRQKGGSAVGPTRRGKGTKIMAIVDRHGLPIAVSIASASPHETKLVEATLEQRFIPETPQRMIGDRAYDSEKLDGNLLNNYAMEMIAPHRTGRRNPPTQDGRPLRRYRHRWKVERLFAWLHNSRRLVTRWEYHAENFLAMLQLACALILLRHL